MVCYEVPLWIEYIETVSLEWGGVPLYGWLQEGIQYAMHLVLKAGNSF